MKTATTCALSQAGLSLANIDYVLCTHLHDDHIGWNT
ncbi:MBL fold metallo-hydrolase [Bradyrhizobium diazoefficiens]|nr:MBL fold metallo-hydrolase [Bradyrhizobium diazoefficiens]